MIVNTDFDAGENFVNTIFSFRQKSMLAIRSDAIRVLTGDDVQCTVLVDM
jgi:hypothetical protein